MWFIFLRLLYAEQLPKRRFELNSDQQSADTEQHTDTCFQLQHGLFSEMFERMQNHDSTSSEL